MIDTAGKEQHENNEEEKEKNEEEQPDEGFVMHTLPVPKPEAKNRRDSMLGLAPAERMKRVI